MNWSLELGTETQWGEIIGIGHFGERYYIVSKESDIAMMPASVVEEAQETKPEPVEQKQELKDGWWFVCMNGEIDRYDSHHPYNPGRPATIDDLAVEIDDVKCWFVRGENGDTTLYQHLESDNSINFRWLCAREYKPDYLKKLAELMSACVICKEQFESLGGNK